MNKFSYCKGFGVDCIDHVSAAFFYFFCVIKIIKIYNMLIETFVTFSWLHGVNPVIYFCPYITYLGNINTKITTIEQ